MSRIESRHEISEATLQKGELRLIRAQSDPPDTPTFPIGVVSRRTGLPPATLRVWERRYGAVVPLRSEMGTRVYTEAHIERLSLLRRVLAGGWRIGQVATLELDRLLELAEQAAPEPRPESDSESTLGDDIERMRTEFLDAAVQLDSDAMSRTLESATLELSRARLFDLFLSPLLREMGQRWAAGSLRPAHEHLASATMRHWMEGLRPSFGLAAPARHLLVTTPRGQLHELGALLAALCAEEVGWRATFLGADLPPEEIALAARELEVDAIALSAIYPSPQLQREVSMLRRLIGPELPVFLGGAGVANHVEAKNDEHLHLGGSLTDFRATLFRLAIGPAESESA